MATCCFLKFVSKNAASSFTNFINNTGYSCIRKNPFALHPGAYSLYIQYDMCYIHTSYTIFKQRKSREEKKLKNIIQVKPKSKYPTVQLWPGITLAQISKRINRNMSDVFEAMSYVENCENYNSPRAEINDRTVIREIALKLGYRVDFTRPDSGKENITSKKSQDLTKRPPPDKNSLIRRSPVVTIMGHVDHGKTTLLDALRHTSVAAQEHGGITQHIGAFSVKVPGGCITFLDTPGHAAFYAMRSRGARATDIVVLVVAADDGVMEQTMESIRFAKEANVPIIVAINKMDKPQVKISEVKQQLLNCGIQLEEFGGDVQSVCISALKNQNLDQLIEAILTLSEVMEISGDPDGPVEGVILESEVDERKGKVSTALIQRGTLKCGKILVAGISYAKVRKMYDEFGKTMSEATLSSPVQIMGWKTLPEAGDLLLEAESEKQAGNVVKYRMELENRKQDEIDILEITERRKLHDEQYNEARQDRLQRGRYRKEKQGIREKMLQWDTSPFFAVVLKGDVHGSIEAISNVLETYTLHNECRLDIIKSAVGNITENDIILAETFDGIIYSFDVEIPAFVKGLAEEKKVQIKTFNVIYHLIDDIKKEISLRLPLMKKEDVIGEAVVLQEFLINEGKKKLPVAGCKCTKGNLKKGNCKILRSEEVIYEGKLISLRHEKSDVDTIKKNVECGLRVEDTSISYLPGDTIICFIENYVPQITTWNPGF